MRNIKKINIEQGVLDMVQAYYEDYRAKQDIITMLFELHKFDEDAAILESVPFKNYERKFREAKILYDACMEEIQDKFIPEEYKKSNFKFEIKFEEKVIEITAL